MRVVRRIDELIGQTPLLRLERLSPEAELWAKCEFLNPVAVKDRPVRQILDDAEADGRIRPGMTLLEATSGNTGMAVAMLGAVRGYDVVLVMSEIQSIERRQVMAALGAKLVLTPAALGTKGAKARLEELRKDNPEWFYVGQHVNPSNPRAHELYTGPELWEQTEQRLDVLVCALGTGGTLCGAGRYLRGVNPDIELVAVEPAEAPFVSEGRWAPHKMMGTAPGFMPDTVDREFITSFELVETEAAFAMCRKLAAAEGILCGISSGAALEASLRLGAQPQYAGKVMATVLPDTGQRYLSVDGLFPGVTS
jgi:cysteine synthase A